MFKLQFIMNMIVLSLTNSGIPLQAVDMVFRQQKLNVCFIEFTGDFGLLHRKILTVIPHLGAKLMLCL